MRKYPGFLNALQQQLEALKPEILERISKLGGLDMQELISLVLEPKDYSVDCPEEPDTNEIFQHKEIETYTPLGQDLVDKHSVALCLISYGDDEMKTNDPKYLLNLFDDETLLSQKIRENLHIKNIWLIVTESNVDIVRKYLENMNLMRDGIEIISQYESICLSPDNQLFLTDKGVKLYPCGHGDTIPVLTNSGILQKFILAGGKHIAIMNINSSIYAVDTSIIGLHHANNVPVTCAVMRKSVEDKTDILCKHNNINQIVEKFRMTPETDTSIFQLISADMIIVKANLDFNMIDWNWYRVKKNLDGSLVIQYERFLHQLTSHFKAQFVEVQRSRGNL